MTADLRVLFGRTALAAATDADLLARYLTGRDGVAFAELVHRHAPAVYAACRRFLADPADLDDAFQATFVLLAGKGGTLARPDRLSGWLCGAAGRIARKARARAARRAAVERPLAAAPEPPAPADAGPADLRAVLDEELARLPPAYRQVLTLCDVDGVPRRAAAGRLGVPESTLSGRLTRARAMLGGRLLRRGVVLGAGLAVAPVSVAAVPAGLVTLTVSRVVADAVPPDIVSLASEGVSSMISIKTAGVLLGGLLLAGASLASLTAGEAAKADPPAAAGRPAPAAPPDPEPAEVSWAPVGGAYSRDGRRFALTTNAHRPQDAADEAKKVLTVYDTATWKAVHTIDMKDIVFRAAFSADGGTLYAACNDGRVYTWDTKTGKPGAPLDPKAGPCYAVELSPDGRLLASGHLDPQANAATIHLWDAATGKPVRRIASDDPLMPSGFAFSPDGKAIAAGCHASHQPGKGAADFHGVVEWEVATGKEVGRVGTPRNAAGATPIVNAVAYTKDGTGLILAGGEAVPLATGGVRCIGFLWVLDRKTGEVRKTLVEKMDTDYVRVLALSADGSKLYAGTHTEPRELVWKGQPTRMPFALLRCWDTTSWDLDWSGEAAPGQASAVVPSPDGRRVGMADTGGFHLFDAKTGDPKGGLVRVDW